MDILFLIVSFGASIIGAICGIGGGIIIKPLLDLSGLASLSTIGFFSCCTVFSMSLYNVSRSLFAKNNVIDTDTGTPLAIGAALGGVLGNKAFDFVRLFVGSDAVTLTTQSACLLLLTVGTLIYTVKKSKITPRPTESKIACLVIGLILGAFSSFLGIGGGPFNLVVLHYFFAMESKKAAANSLYIILFSQATNLLVTIIGGKVPDFSVMALCLMICGGVCGGIVGRKISAKIDNRTVDKLFIMLMCVIILICCYNGAKAFI